MGTKSQNLNHALTDLVCVSIELGYDTQRDKMLTLGTQFERVESICDYWMT